MRALLIASLALVACEASTTTPETTSEAPGARSPATPRAAERAADRTVIHHADERAAPAPRAVTEGEPVAVGLLPPVEVQARPRRRMNLDQLARSMRQVSGGIGWTEDRGGREVDLFVELSATLGKPDYLQVVSEDLEPSALFLKFLDDAARSVCGRMVLQDLAAGPQADRTIFKHVEPGEAAADADVDANLAWLIRRFHGRIVAPEGERVRALRWLFDSVVHITSEPIDGWNAVCVGLFTHVDFYSY